MNLSKARKDVSAWQPDHVNIELGERLIDPETLERICECGRYKRVQHQAPIHDGLVLQQFRDRLKTSAQFFLFHTEFQHGPPHNSLAVAMADVTKKCDSLLDALMYQPSGGLAQPNTEQRTGLESRTPNPYDKPPLDCFPSAVNRSLSQTGQDELGGSAFDNVLIGSGSPQVRQTLEAVISLRRWASNIAAKESTKWRHSRQSSGGQPPDEALARFIQSLAMLYEEFFGQRAPKYSDGPFFRFVREILNTLDRKYWSDEALQRCIARALSKHGRHSSSNP